MLVAYHLCCISRASLSGGPSSISCAAINRALNDGKSSSVTKTTFHCLSRSMTRRAPRDSAWYSLTRR